MAAPLDVILVLDTTGSTGALLPSWQANVQNQFIAPIQSRFPGSRFALVSHADFPIAPYGRATCQGSPDQAFQLQAPLSADTSLFLQRLSALGFRCGDDAPESQYVALTLALTGQGIDLDGADPVEYSDLGDVAPSAMGLSDNQVVIYHFTFPPEFHDRDLNSSYPVASASSVPGKEDTFAAFVASDVIYFGLVTDPVAAARGSWVDPQTGAPFVPSAAAAATDPMQELAQLTGGAVYTVGATLSGLQAATAQSLQVVEPLPVSPLVVPASSSWSLIVLAFGLGLVALFQVARRDSRKS